MWKDERKAKKNTFGNLTGGVTDGLTNLTGSVKKLPTAKGGEENTSPDTVKK